MVRDRSSPPKAHDHRDSIPLDSLHYRVCGTGPGPDRRHTLFLLSIAVKSGLERTWGSLVCRRLILAFSTQRIAGHADSRTTKLYDRRGQKVLLEDMEHNPERICLALLGG